MELGKYSFGTGDRFELQGIAQLEAIIKINKLGIPLTPVWNKSYREHTTIGSNPSDTMTEAENAVKSCGWKDDYFVDADHINMSNVDFFIDYANFFTIDVATFIGEKANENDIEAFIESNKKHIGSLEISGIDELFEISEDLLIHFANNYLYALNEAEKIYNHIASKKGVGSFITEISMDETKNPQTPIELFFILKTLADKNIPVDTIAPKFPGRFNKGVDYQGSLNDFAEIFENDLLIIDYVVERFGLKKDLKLSVHSGSDKFSIYPIIGDLIRKYEKGIHVKTAGTTWLEEVAGLALAGGDGLLFVKELYTQSLLRIDELCAPYGDVIDVKDGELPSATVFSGWDKEKIANTIQHDLNHADYNSNVRQLLHVSYKIASESMEEFKGLLLKHKVIVNKCVRDNIYEKHLKRLFL